MNLTPITLFVYNRPRHTRQALEALANNDLAAKSILYVYADGPKPGATAEELEMINDTRLVIKERNWCKKTVLIEKEKNVGLANSIISGVTEVVNKHGQVIVLEDDIIVSPYFLKYMNDGLETYRNNAKVISIHGYNYPIDTTRLPETFFMKGADCQGWATWTDSWKLFEKDAQKLLSEILEKKLQKEFDLEDSYPYTKMLQNQVNKKIDSWAIRWYASAFLNDKYTLYPKTSIIFNIGFDNSGTHSGSSDNFNNKNWNNKRPVGIIPYKKIETNTLAMERWQNYLTGSETIKKFKPMSYSSEISKLYNKLKRGLTAFRKRKAVERF